MGRDTHGEGYTMVRDTHGEGGIRGEGEGYTWGGTHGEGYTWGGIYGEGYTWGGRDNDLPVNPDPLLQPRLKSLPAFVRGEEPSYLRPRVSRAGPVANCVLHKWSAQGKAPLLGEPKPTSQGKKETVASCVCVRWSSVNLVQ